MPERTATRHVVTVGTSPDHVMGDIWFLTGGDLPAGSAGPWCAVSTNDAAIADPWWQVGSPRFTTREEAERWLRTGDSRPADVVAREHAQQERAQEAERWRVIIELGARVDPVMRIGSSMSGRSWVQERLNRTADHGHDDQMEKLAVIATEIDRLIVSGDRA